MRAQKIEIGGGWAGYNYSHLCPTYSFSYKGLKTFPLNNMEDNHISLAGNDSTIAIEKAKEYIKERGGDEFLKHTDFDSIDITYKDSLAAFQKGPNYDLEKCGDIKYYVRFLFHSDHIDFLHIGIAMNDKFELLSPLDFPNIKKNPDFYKVIEPLEAYKIALKKHKKLIGNADTITLTYEESLNSFVWEIIGEKKDETPKTERKTRINFKYGLVWINASTGKIQHANTYDGYYLINPRYF